MASNGKHWKHFLWGFFGGFFFLQGLNFLQDNGVTSWLGWVSLVAAAVFFVQQHLTTNRTE